MHSIAIASLLAAAATFTSAAPSANQPRGAFYVCGTNGFRGDCSVDPCALPWCSDYALNTYVPIGSTEPVNPSVVTPTPNGGDICPQGTGYFQSCAANGFRGCCKSDACGSSWCPDYKFGTYEPVNTWKRVVRGRQPAADPTLCPAGTGYYQSCAANGFRGCCKSDACGSSWCPDYKFGTYEPVGSTTTTAVTTPEVPVSEPASAGWADPTACPPNTGYYQVCGTPSGSITFRGCCKTDACSLGYCRA